MLMKGRVQTKYPYLHRGGLQGAEGASVPGGALADVLQAAGEPEAEVQDTLRGKHHGEPCK